MKKITLLICIIMPLVSMQNQQKNQKLEYEKKKEQWEEACPKTV